MSKLAFLASKATLPGSPVRREDAHEHDLQVAALKTPLKRRGLELVALDWMDRSVDWSDFSAAVIGTTWDYWDHQDFFLETLRGIEAAGTPVFNPPDLVAWNSRKTYLQDLEARGARIIPTLWPSRPSVDEIIRSFDTLGTNDIVIKRQVGAGAFDQIRYRKGDNISDYGFDAMIQPFVPTIQTEGEYSIVMIDGNLSHALLKRPQSGDYRIQSLYGGQEERVDLSSDDLKSAKDILDCLDDTPLYARVDMVRGADGDLILMELELIEPYLYPEQSDDLGVRYADGLIRRLS